MKKIRVALLIFFLFLPIFAFSAEDTSAIAKRIAPLGTVNIEGPSTTASSTPTGANKSSEDIYKEKCTICHASGVAGAPKFRDKTDWAPRSKLGMNDMLKKAISGLNAMPPRGTCTECSDEDLKKAIQYMLPK